MASIYVTPLIRIDPGATHLSIETLLDLVHFGVTAYCTSEEQAVDLLVALGKRSRQDAERHVRFCVTGVWEPPEDE